jgi:hypothetical protein
MGTAGFGCLMAVETTYGGRVNLLWRETSTQRRGVGREGEDRLLEGEGEKEL